MNQLLMKNKGLVRWLALGLFAAALLVQLVYVFGSLANNSQVDMASGILIFLVLGALCAMVVAGFLKDKPLWILGGTFLLLGYIGLEGLSDVINQISSLLDQTTTLQNYGFSIVMMILIGLTLAASLAFFVLGYFFKNPFGKSLYAPFLAVAAVLYLALAIGDGIVTARGWLYMLQDLSYLLLLAGLALSGVYCLEYIASGKTAPEASK